VIPRIREVGVVGQTAPEQERAEVDEDAVAHFTVGEVESVLEEHCLEGNSLGSHEQQLFGLLPHFDPQEHEQQHHPTCNLELLAEFTHFEDRIVLPPLLQIAHLLKRRADQKHWHQKRRLNQIGISYCQQHRRIESD